MIPGDFKYYRPSSKSEALQMIADAGDGGRPLAGGQSLIPMMKLRMATPSALIDISKLQELRGIEITENSITIGSATTQHELIASDELASACPIVREAALQIADPQVRYCGTIGGNVGNGDPGNDMPGLMQCLEAQYLLETTSGSRQVAARDYYQAAFFTALESGEIITAIRFARPPSGQGYAYKKLKRKVGDYATAAAAVLVEMSGGTVHYASIALTNVADTPLYAADAVNKIVGTQLEAADIEASVQAAEAITNPASDGRGSAEYRTKMAGVMVRRALEEARSRAGEVDPSSRPSGSGNKGGIFGWLKR